MPRSAAAVFKKDDYVILLTVDGVEMYRRVVEVDRVGVVIGEGDDKELITWQHIVSRVTLFLTRRVKEFPTLCVTEFPTCFV